MNIVWYETSPDGSFNGKGGRNLLNTVIPHNIRQIEFLVKFLMVDMTKDVERWSSNWG